MSIKEENKGIYGDVITDTQRKSWNQTQSKMGKQDEIIYETIKLGGLTNFELCEIVKRPAHGVSGSLTRLREKSRIEDTGNRRLNPKSGKTQIVWRIATSKTLQPQGELF